MVEPTLADHHLTGQLLAVPLSDGAAPTPVRLGQVFSINNLRTFINLSAATTL